MDVKVFGVKACLLQCQVSFHGPRQKVSCASMTRGPLVKVHSTFAGSCKMYKRGRGQSWPLYDFLMWESAGLTATVGVLLFKG